MTEQLRKHGWTLGTMIAVTVLSALYLASTGLLHPVPDERKTQLERLSDSLNRAPTEEEERFTRLQWEPVLEEINRQQARDVALCRQIEVNHASANPATESGSH